MSILTTETGPFLNRDLTSRRRIISNLSSEFSSFTRIVELMYGFVYNYVLFYKTRVRQVGGIEVVPFLFYKKIVSVLIVVFFYFIKHS